MKHDTAVGKPEVPSKLWRYLRLFAETEEDRATLEALASLIPEYDYDKDRYHRGSGNRIRKIFPVIKNENNSHELRLVCIPPEKAFSFEKKHAQGGRA